MILTGQQQLANVFPWMNAALKPTVHPPPELDDLWRQIGSDNVFQLARSEQWVDVLVHVVSHKPPKRKSSLRQLQVDAILLTVPDERSELTTHDVVVEDKKKSFIELKSVGLLLHQLPCGIEELCEHWRDLRAEIIENSRR